MHWYRPKKVENKYFMFPLRSVGFKKQTSIKKRIITRMNSITCTNAVAYFPTVSVQASVRRPPK